MVRNKWRWARNGSSECMWKEVRKKNRIQRHVHRNHGKQAKDIRRNRKKSNSFYGKNNQLFLFSYISVIEC